MLLFFFWPVFCNYWPVIFRLKQLLLYVQEEEASSILEDKCSINTAASTDQYKRDYKMCLGVSATNDLSSTLQRVIVPLRSHDNLRN